MSRFFKTFIEVLMRGLDDTTEATKTLQQVKMLFTRKSSEEVIGEFTKETINFRNPMQEGG
ncbi:hypothetical protein [Borrelia sp. RT5S]|uniref:hypothetical protein n=1 Tax=Borrelia sp. RT5S TaxID=2898581 RepID=UPI001E4A6D58|nr:hypothetical protein [Borrelia sp. RT5S]UGQ16745.1 hypothetical protein LSO06_05340 [Borrelia sp. RT5S]